MSTMFQRYPKFTLNKAEFQWVQEFADSEPYLECVSPPIGCGNPWNLIEEGNREAALKLMPAFSKSNKPMINVSFFSASELKSYLQYLIGADCWKVLTVDTNHSPQKVFFDLFKDSSQSNASRDILIENASPLIEELQRGMEVRIVMNEYFQDYIIRKVPSSELFTSVRLEYPSIE